MTSKLVELDPHNPDHYSIINVNRDESSLPINWTYADVVLGRIRFHNGRSPVGNVWGVQSEPVQVQARSMTQNQRMPAPRQDVEVVREHHKTNNKNSKQSSNKNKSDKKIREREKIVVVKNKTEKQFSSEPTNVVIQNVVVDDVEMIKKKKTINDEMKVNDNNKLNVDVVDSGSLSDSGKSYAEIVRGYFTGMNNNNRPITVTKSLTESLSSTSTSESSEKLVRSLGAIPKDLITKTENKKKHHKRGGQRNVQEIHSETSSTSGDDIHERYDRSSRKKGDRKVTHKKTINVEEMMATKRIILIEHEARYKVPVQTIHLQLPQTYAVKVDKPRDDVKAVAIENFATHVETIKLDSSEFLCEEKRQTKNEEKSFEIEADVESISTATLDTIVDRSLDFPIEKDVVLTQEIISEKIEQQPRRMENIQEYTDTSEDETVTIQGRLEISFIVEDEQPKIEHDITTSIHSVQNRKHRENKNDLNTSQILDDFSLIHDDKTPEVSLIEDLPMEVEENVFEKSNQKISQITSSIITNIEETQRQMKELSVDEIIRQYEIISEEVDSTMKTPQNDNKLKIQDVLQTMMKNICVETDLTDENRDDDLKEWEVITEETEDELRADAESQVIISSPHLSPTITTDLQIITTNIPINVDEQVTNNNNRNQT
jgi:hypothetical protein